MDNTTSDSAKKKPILPVISLIAYAFGAILLFVAPQNIFLSPGISLPAMGITSPLFFSMLLLAATSAVFIFAVFQKDREIKTTSKVSPETKKFIEKNLEDDVENISASVLLRKEQSKRDFNRFIYIIGLLSVALALIQAWKIFYIGAGSGISIIYWGAYLAIAAAWFGYGIYYQNKAIMFTYGLWIFLEILIINGILFYS